MLFLLLCLAFSDASTSWCLRTSWVFLRNQTVDGWREPINPVFGHYRRPTFLAIKNALNSYLLRSSRGLALRERVCYVHICNSKAQSDWDQKCLDHAS